MAEDIFDFGFTAVTEQELETVQATTQQLESTASDLTEVQRRLDKLYDSIQPLLNNLKNDPSKDYIYWPNRTVKIEQFQDLLDNIYWGR